MEELTKEKEAIELKLNLNEMEVQELKETIVSLNHRIFELESQMK